MREQFFMHDFMHDNGYVHLVTCSRDSKRGNADRKQRRFGRSEPPPSGHALFTAACAVLVALIMTLTPISPVAGAQFLNIPYVKGGTERQTLDLFTPDGMQGKRVPVIVYIHGGGWRGGSKSALREQAKQAFLDAGFAVASINYTLVDTAIFPQQIYDVKSAVRFLRANRYNYSLSGKVGVFGGSAGGQLAALAGTTCDVKELEGVRPQWKRSSSCVDAVVDFYGPTDFLQMHTHINSSAETAYLGCSTLLDCPEAVASANPITYIELQSRDDRRTSKKHNQHPQNLPPFLIAHGDADTAVPYLQSNILYTALQQACSEATLYILEGQGHVFDAILDGPNYPVTTYLHSKKCKFADGSNTTPLTYQTLVDFFGKHLR